MKTLLTACLVAGAVALSAIAHADESPLQWHNESLTLLAGKHYKVNPHRQYTATFEHASGWSWGDVFFFLDSIHYKNEKDANLGKSTYYGEFTPRFSLGKITGKDFSFGIVQDVLLATTYEFGENRQHNYLIGPGVDLAIPGFDYFQLNLYYRKSDSNKVPAGAIQVTPVWAVTIPVGNSDILIDGYIDWVVNNKTAKRSSAYHQNDYHANLHINPQVKYDLGKALGYEAKHLYVGFEYDYWKNKYGIKDSKGFRTDQNTYSALLKYHF